jgi:hypothetical protein
MVPMAPDDAAEVPTCNADPLKGKPPLAFVGNLVGNFVDLK